MDVRGKLVELPIEDVLLVLREEHRQRTDSYITYLAHGGKGDPAEEVGLDALAIAISALEKTKWISVKDRLPEPWEQVLIYSRHDFCESAFYIGVPGKWRVTWNHEMLDADSVTHWMPMPQPPKGE